MSASHKPFAGQLSGTRLNTRRARCQGSRNIRLAAFKSFMHFVEYRVPSAIEQIRRVLAIPAKKAESRLVRHLTTGETQAILNAPDPTGRNGLRHRAMLHLCYAGGLRVSELFQDGRSLQRIALD
jgi:integrase/recombinase XerD